MSQIHDSILSCVGNTPVIKINRLGPGHVNLYVKVEAFNPMSSVKDRLALAVIEDAERRGTLKPGQTVIEATSGNTGIALAMVCAVKGYPFVAVMADSFSIERRKLMKALGAKVVLTPAAERGTGMVNKANELAEKYGYFKSDQFNNPANPAYHAQTTAAEILSDFRGKRLDFFVSGTGTGGTLAGCSRTLKAAIPDLKIICAEHAAAPLLAKGTWASHPIQGWTPDFVPGVLEGVENYVNEFVTVTTEEAIQSSRSLATKEGIFCGLSSGATFAAALKVAQTAPEGSNILAILPDTGERYFSTILFKDISEVSDNIDS
eukprot:TRINITY_DN616_c0_g1_i7.p1 TRINITY_DN616_c0_g1~~TRINITY_DN616_c0_g1_i7.p1  ORF type:complete len:319 (-),score=45.35 TRINITY_DN616_c0_g1_i7:194-1150(-)